jgi:hypothetical protein
MLSLLFGGVCGDGLQLFGTITPPNKSSENAFGHSVALCGTSQHFAIGVPSTTGAGEVRFYRYEKHQLSW